MNVQLKEMIEGYKKKEEKQGWNRVLISQRVIKLLSSIDTVLGCKMIKQTSWRHSVTTWEGFFI